MTPKIIKELTKAEIRARLKYLQELQAEAQAKALPENPYRQANIKRYENLLK